MRGTGRRLAIATRVCSTGTVLQVSVLLSQEELTQ